jgi:Site-specific recombinase XerD
MSEEILTETGIEKFKNHLIESEKSLLTVQKYIRELNCLKEFMKGQTICKTKLLEYREFLQKKGQSRTVNTKLSAINAYLEFAGLAKNKIKFLKVQHRVFANDEQELSEAEYRRLLAAAYNKRNKRLYHIIMTICATGIRVSELFFITVEALRAGKVEIRLKGKVRTVILQKELADKLKRYVKERGIRSGIVFCTSSGKALDRSNIHHDMKKICKAARVDSAKVFPHNLRHLFARSYYAVEKNLAHLADILGHSSVETTRIYVAVGQRAHRRTLEKMRLIL